MNILVVSPWFPWPPFGGALIRVFETVRHLSRHNRVTLIAPVNDGAGTRQRPTLCDSVVAVPVSEKLQAVQRRLARGLARGMPFIQGLHFDSNMAEAIRDLTDRQAFDIIHVEHSFMAPYMASVSPRSTAKKVLSMHNVESLRFKRELQYARGMRLLALLSDHVLFRSWEEEAVRAFDGIVAVSEPEKTWARKYAPKALVTVIPNGVDTEYFSPAEASPTTPMLAFTGLMNYPPNVDAVVWFCEEVLPIVARKQPDVRFTIIGDKPTPRVRALARRPGVDVTGRVPDVRPYLADCTAAIVPVRSGAGTRLKILEAMAMQRPVVSTRLGAEGLDVTDGVNILLGDTPREVAAQIERLLASPQLKERIARAGRLLAEDSYDWHSCLTKLDDLYQALLSTGDLGERITVRESA